MTKRQFKKALKAGMRNAVMGTCYYGIKRIRRDGKKFVVIFNSLNSHDTYGDVCRIYSQNGSFIRDLY